ncbi:DUF5686 and carboxypeptidase regulatory-like domain-containing protein [Candidatus Sulfidibacterium hydrothermale]|uniref:DUF5686 and carboxypeptidase-like regulatory domain-containing protein n=1 Tax=Candidatus Sulfidibacterium hydrothermale TaxID=2875962 RepID=UPI001F0A4C64|nr:DUF5686 and carboxypeptidase-like regulatory domain-containing protein [Candidatus Sulfidibacterium hydrothermale]UBM63429.1 DUF5686 and carboxypeptidase regulatory-like domain-containing protein [Candidatus Sulfidibacterium hydrothermale]
MRRKGITASAWVGLFTLIFVLQPWFVRAQNITVVRGSVIDARTRKPLPFVNVVFVGTTIGTMTDINGKYSLMTKKDVHQLQTSYIGYYTMTKNVRPGKSQVINFRLKQKNIQLNELVIKGKRKRYRNKNNPAVALIKKVIANKKRNRQGSLDYYSYDKYEKNEFDINNITDAYENKKIFKKIHFIFNYTDTSQRNGKVYLPVFLKETRSEVFFRKSPPKKRVYVLGSKMTGFHEYIDNQGVGFIVQNMFQDINIYDNTIMLLTNPFVSPVSTIAPSVYKFRITDTLDVNGYNCIKVDFVPRNKQSFAFIGSLYITNDNRYAIVKADMHVPRQINLNFVTYLHLIQEFSFINNKVWMLTKDQLVVDFNLTKKGAGMIGRKTVDYGNFTFNKAPADSVFKGADETVYLPGYKNRPPSFWTKKRLTKLSPKEKNIYVMVDSVQNVPAFKRTMNIIMLFVAGYWNFNKIDVGPVNTFYSFNDVEGFRLRLGARTSDKFSKTFRISGYGVYGFKDKRFKYSIMGTMSLNHKPLKDNPKNYLSIQYQYETNFPGMKVQFINEDNFLLSFKRGVADKILYNRMFKIEHYKDWPDGFSTDILFRNINQEPGGTLYFTYEDGHTVSSITESEITARFRFAPDEKFYQGMDYRIPIITNKPIFQVSITQGIKGLFSSDYSYTRVTLDAFKRFYVAPFGFLNSEVEVGKIFGEVPFPLLDIPRANQTYSYQLRSYNMMNFLEFANDKYVSFFLEHHFNGYILNKIPLIKKLKWRSIISVKVLYGGLSDKNNPEVTPGLMQFPTDADGNPTTFILKDTPYIEGSVGIGNIFKFFRVDLVKRFTYLDNPHVAEYGIRARFKFDF